MNLPEKPEYIQLQHVPFSSKDIHIAESGKQIPFVIKRAYWITQRDHALEVGNHAHTKLSQVFVALNGSIEVNLTDLDGNTEKFVLDDPSKGLYVPKLFWKKLDFAPGAILLCLTSHLFEEDVYIKDLNEFLSYKA